MKKLLAIAVLVGATSTIQLAQAESEFSHNAEFRLRYQYDQNVNGDKNNISSQSKVDQRFKLSTMFRASEAFSAKLTLLHNAGWGSNDLAVPSTTAGTDTTGDTGRGLADGINSAENMVLVNEAYGSWMVNDATVIRAGRGSFTMADGSVIHQNDWEKQPYAFDGLLVSHELEPVKFSVWAVKFAEYTTAAGITADDAEANNYGLSIDVKALPEFLNMVNVHVIQTNKDASSVATAPADNGQDIMRYGLTVGGDIVGLDYRVVYAASNGDFITPGAAVKIKSEGTMMHGEIGYTLAELMESRFYFAYHSDSGDKSSTPANEKSEQYDPYFYDLHGNAGMMDVVKWGNLTYMSAGVTVKPMEDLQAGLHYHMFERTENTTGVSAGVNGSGILTTAGNANDKSKIGDELNLSVEKTYEGGFSMIGWAGMFMPGEFLKNNGTGPKDTYTQIFLQGKMTF